MCISVVLNQTPRNRLFGTLCKGRRENPLGFAVNHVDTDRMAWGGPLFEENCGQRGAFALDGLIKSRGYLDMQSTGVTTETTDKEYVDCIPAIALAVANPRSL